MDEEVQKYFIAGLFGLLASLATYLATRKKNAAESANLLVTSAVTLVDSYEKRIKNLEHEVSELRSEYKELLKANQEIIKENKSLHVEVVRLETILYNKGDMDK